MENDDASMNAYGALMMGAAPLQRRHSPGRGCGTRDAPTAVEVRITAELVFASSSTLPFIQ